MVTNLIINSEDFEKLSKKEITKRIREVLLNVANLHIINNKTNEASYTFNTEKDHTLIELFKNLIKRHPNYDDKFEVDSFEIYRKPYSKAVELFILKRACLRKRISWVSCCNKKMESGYTKMNRLFREAIDYQSKSYRNERYKNGSYICDGCDLFNYGLEVDHISKFSEMLKDFKKIKIESSTNEIDEWVKYHESNVKYQLLCKSCHYNKTYINTN